MRNLVFALALMASSPALAECAFTTVFYADVRVTKGAPKTSFMTEVSNYKRCTRFRRFVAEDYVDSRDKNPGRIIMDVWCSKCADVRKIMSEFAIKTEAHRVHLHHKWTSLLAKELRNFNASRQTTR